MSNNETRRPQPWFYNGAAGRWELRGRQKGEPVAWADENQFYVRGTLAYDALSVGTQATIRDVVIANTGSIANLTTTNGLLNNTKLGATGGTISVLLGLTGTLPGITGIGSGGVAVATMTGVASAGVAAGDIIFGVPKAALGGHTGIVGWHVPTTNVINAYIANTKPDSEGSFVPVGVDVAALRISKT
jgi:hypothetical protein